MTGPKVSTTARMTMDELRKTIEVAKTLFDQGALSVEGRDELYREACDRYFSSPETKP